MAKWFKFEEKKPRKGVQLILWHSGAEGAYFAELSQDGVMYLDYGHIAYPHFMAEVTHWQYAPKGPKEVK